MTDNIEKEINVRKVIEESTRKVSLSDLEKKGFKSVKVIREEQINELIRRAVDIAMARRGKSATAADRIADAARREYFEETKKELKKLMKERAQLEYAVERQRHYVEETRTNFERMREEHEALKRAAQAEKARYEKEITKLRTEVSGLGDTLEIERKVHEEHLRQKEQESARLREMLGKFIKDYPEKKETDEIAELRTQIRAMSERDGRLAEQIKDLVGEMTSKLKDELSGRIIAGAPVGVGGPGGPGGPLEAKEIILDALFKDTADLDSNIDQLEIKERKVEGVSDALAKLKNMRKRKKE